jgi:hypothetical protein
MYLIRNVTATTKDTVEVALAGTANILKTFAAAADIETAVGLTTTNPNRTCWWYVVAKNKWNVTTTSTYGSDTKSNAIIFEKNITPAAVTLSVPADGDKKVVTSTSTYTIGWNGPVDNNGMIDIKLGNDLPKTYFGVEYKLDTLFFEVTMTKGRDFPTGSAASAPATIIDTVVSLDTLPLTNSRLWTMLGGATGSDSVLWTWSVKVADRFPYNFGTASTARTFILTKIDNMYNIVIEAGKKYSTYKDTTNLSVDAYLPIAVTAVDGSGDVIRGFNNFLKVGTSTADAIVVKVAGATVSTDALQYTDVTNDTVSAKKTLTPTTTGGTYKFSVPVTWFVNGVAQLYLKDTKAGDVLRLVIDKADNPTMLKYVETEKGKKGILVNLNSSDTSRYYKTLPSVIARVITKVTPRRSGVVFLSKAMEVIITPADRYNNELVTLTSPANVLLQINPPDDIEEGNLVGARIINGKTYFYLHPNMVHDIAAFNPLQVGAYLPLTNGLPDVTTGNTVNVLVVNHAPKPGALGDVYSLVGAAPVMVTNNTIPLATYSDKFEFRWTAALDTNDTPLKKSNAPDPNNPAYWITDQCVPIYTFKIKEYASYEFPDSILTDTKITLGAGKLYEIFLATRSGVAKTDTVHWYIIVEDEVYKYTNPVYTNLLKSAEKILYLFNAGINKVVPNQPIPVAYGLDQNYPNPFNPTTTINYQLPKESSVKLVIYNILGQPVRTLVNDRQAASSYTITWDGKNDNGVPVSTGTYIYRLTAGDYLATKKMNLLK